MPVNVHVKPVKPEPNIPEIDYSETIFDQERCFGIKAPPQTEAMIKHGRLLDSGYTQKHE